MFSREESGHKSAEHSGGETGKCAGPDARKPWHSFDAEMKRRYGGKVYRLSLSSGCSCPNRDGKKGTGGCSFCSEGGSGEFASDSRLPIEDQIRMAKERLSAKWKKTPAGYVAYFQSFSNTYGDPAKLEALYGKVLELPDILALSIATRPDCLGPEIMDMLRRLNSRKPVWVELGLQTIRDDTARLFQRAYPTEEFVQAVRKLKESGIEAIVHVMAGLPGEKPEDTLETIRFLAQLQTGHGGIDGIKITLLYVLKNTLLAAQLEKGELELYPYSEEEYAAFLAEAVSLLPRRIVVHRMTGDPPRSLLISPGWTTNKKHVLNTIARVFREKGAVQGCHSCCETDGSLFS